MKKKQIISLAVAVVLLGGLTAMYLSLNAQQERIEPTPTPASQIVQLIVRTEAEVERVVFNTPEHSFAVTPEQAADGSITWIYANDRAILLNQRDVRDMVRNITNLTASERFLEEVDDPANFGIGNDTWAEVFFSDGTRQVIRAGLFTPARNQAYLMVDGDPALYLVPAIFGERFAWGLDRIIDRSVPIINLQQVDFLYINERDRQPLQFSWQGTEEDKMRMIQQFGGFLLTMDAPHQGRDMHFSNFERIALEGFDGFQPQSLVELQPRNLAQYGLDNPALTFIMRDLENELHLIFGNSHDNELIYMQFGDRPHVFLAEKHYVNGLFDLNPFQFIDRFVALINIVDVSAITITAPERQNYNMTIEHWTDESDRAQIIPTVNGQEVQDGAFRTFYQRLIAISFEQEIEIYEPTAPPLITLTYHLTDGSEPAVIKFFAYDPNFYAVQRDDQPIQFVASHLSVNLMFNAAVDLLDGSLDR